MKAKRQSYIKQNYFLGNDFLDMIAKAQETKQKIDKWLKASCKGNNQQSKKANYWMGENTCKPYLWKGVKIQNI